MFRFLFIFALSIIAFGMAPVQAAEGTWYDFTDGCIESHHRASYDGVCETTEGGYGGSNSAWFVTAVDFGVSGEMTCDVTVTAGFNDSQPNEKAYLIFNEGTGSAETISIPDMGGSLPSGKEVSLGTVRITSGANVIKAVGQSSSPWSQSIHFFKIKVSSCTGSTPTTPPTNGSCGVATSAPSCAAPTAGLCASGTADSMITGGSTHSWMCRGEDGGTDASCATVQSCTVAVQGACGTAAATSSCAAPTAGLCASGVPTGVTMTGSTHSWICQGAGGGTSASCSATRSCPTPESQCVVNGVKEPGEECDDGNYNPYDSTCALNCKVPICGDDYQQPGEACDDGNRTNGDGCSSACQVESVGGTCGSAESVPSCSAPSGGLCTSGAPSNVQYDPATLSWTWNCGGTSCDTKKRCGYTEVTP